MCAFRDVSDIRPSQETELARHAHPEDSHRTAATTFGGGTLNSNREAAAPRTKLAKEEF